MLVAALHRDNLTTELVEKEGPLRFGAEEETPMTFIGHLALNADVK